MKTEEVIRQFQYDETTPRGKKTISWKGMIFPYSGTDDEGLDEVEKKLSKIRNKKIAHDMKMMLFKGWVQQKIKFPDTELITGGDFEAFRDAIFGKFYSGQEMEM